MAEPVEGETMRCSGCGEEFCGDWYCPECEKERKETDWTPIEEGLPTTGDCMRDYWLTVEDPDGEIRTYTAGEFWDGQFWTTLGDLFDMKDVKAWQPRDARPEPWEG